MWVLLSSCFQLLSRAGEGQASPPRANSRNEEAGDNTSCFRILRPKRPSSVGVTCGHKKTPHYIIATKSNSKPNTASSHLPAGQSSCDRWTAVEPVDWEFSWSQRGQWEAEPRTIRPGTCPPQRGQRLKVRRGKPHHLLSSETKIWNKRGVHFWIYIKIMFLETNKEIKTHLRCSMFGRIHLCGTLTIFGRPVVPDVCSTYAKSLCLACSNPAAVSPAPSAVWAPVCSGPCWCSATGSSSMCIRVSLNLGNTAHTSTEMCLMRAAWNRLKRRKENQCKIHTGGKTDYKWMVIVKKRS